MDLINKMRTSVRKEGVWQQTSSITVSAIYIYTYIYIHIGIDIDMMSWYLVRGATCPLAGGIPAGVWTNRTVSRDLSRPMQLVLVGPADTWRSPDDQQTRFAIDSDRCHVRFYP